MNKENRVRIKYCLSDGYVGKRPQYLSFPLDEWNALTEDEKEQYVDETIKQNLVIDWEVVP